MSKNYLFATLGEISVKLVSNTLGNHYSETIAILATCCPRPTTAFFAQKTHTKIATFKGPETNDAFFASLCPNDALIGCKKCT